MRAKELWQLLSDRRFHPWEGGEGLVSGQYVRGPPSSGTAGIEDRQCPRSRAKHFDSRARNYPENLGEAKHLLTLENPSRLFFLDLPCRNSVAIKKLVSIGTKRYRQRRANSEMTFYKALALRELQNDSQGRVVV